MVTPEQIKSWIEVGLAGSEAKVTGDGHHFEATIISNEFKGKNTVARHRLVYSALGDKMKSEIHALSMKTMTPEEL